MNKIRKRYARIIFIGGYLFLAFFIISLTFRDVSSFSGDFNPAATARLLYTRDTAFSSVDDVRQFFYEKSDELLKKQKTLGFCDISSMDPWWGNSSTLTLYPETLYINQTPNPSRVSYYDCGCFVKYVVYIPLGYDGDNITLQDGWAYQGVRVCNSTSNPMTPSGWCGGYPVIERKLPARFLRFIVAENGSVYSTCFGQGDEVPFKEIGNGVQVESGYPSENKVDSLPTDIQKYNMTKCERCNFKVIIFGDVTYTDEGMFLNDKKVAISADSALDSAGLHNCSREFCRIWLLQDHEYHVVYHIEDQSPGKLLGLFKVSMKTVWRVDASSGEVLSRDRPWWGFIVIRA